MFSLVAGSALYIGEPQSMLPLDRALSVPLAQDWTAIAGGESFGVLGVAWETYAFAPDSPDPEVTRTIKTNMAPQAMQLIFGQLPEDPGQVQLWDAARSQFDYGFRLDFGEGQQRYWLGLVTGLGEVFDVADSVIKLQATIQVNSSIVKGEW